MTATPPGTKSFAPQARFVVLSGKKKDKEKKGDDDVPLDADMLSVSVTQVHSGVSQLSVTFNNQRNVGGRPVHPPWKYNALDKLSFGQRVRVDFRYGDETWMPMIAARITDIDFSFPSSGGAKLTLKGEDYLSLLKRKDTKDKRYRKEQELDIVAASKESALKRSKCGLKLAKPLIKRTVFDDSLSTVMHQKSQTYLQFIQSLAERLDYEVFVDFKDPTDPKSDVEFHFEPARSLQFKKYIELTWGQNIIEFNPKFKVWEQFTSAIARGRHPSSRRRIDEKVKADAIAADLHHVTGTTKPLNAIEAREKFFVNDAHKGENQEPISVTNLDAKRAAEKAKAVLRKRAREFLTVESSTIGLMSLRPGTHINIREMRAPFDGIYYVTKAVHSLDAGGYRTKFSLRRPGMLPPEGYLADNKKTAAKSASEKKKEPTP